MGIAILAGYLALSVAVPPKPAGFLADPKSGHGPAVLVLHPWWGLNGDVKAFCRRLANEGFVAFAPDLFDGKTATTPAAAEALVKKFQPKSAEIQAEIADSAKFLAEKTGQEKLAVVGFSFGAYYALEFSNTEPDRVRSVVVFYGTGHEDFSRSKASYLGHFAEKDEFEPRSSVESLKGLLKKAGRPATIYTYPGTGHWFFEPSVKAAYRKEASRVAWERTLRFLRSATR